MTEPNAGLHASDELASRPVRRGLDASALVSLLPVLYLLPLSELCTYPFAVVLGALTGTHASWWVIGFLALGVVQFVPAVQQGMARWLFGVRRPTDQEWQRLAGPWSAVLHRAGLPANRYRLLAQTSDDVNALATGGHIVSVTSAAIFALPPDELTGVLAHELGHHLGMHAAVSSIVNWLMLPIRAVFAIANLVTRMLAGLARLFGVFGNSPAAFVLVIFAWLLRFCMWMIGLFLKLVMLSLSIFGRSSEFAADETAVQMGFGAPLARALGDLLQVQGGEQQRSLRDAISATHPPLTKRITRIDRQLAAGSNDRIYRYRPLTLVGGVALLAVAVIGLIVPLAQSGNQSPSATAEPQYQLNPLGGAPTSAQSPTQPGGQSTVLGQPPRSAAATARSAGDPDNDYTLSVEDGWQYNLSDGHGFTLRSTGGGVAGDIHIDTKSQGSLPGLYKDISSGYLLKPGQVGTASLCSSLLLDKSQYWATWGPSAPNPLPWSALKVGIQACVDDGSNWDVLTVTSPWNGTSITFEVKVWKCVIPDGKSVC